LNIKRIEIKNRKATFNFKVEQTYDCGILLSGSEVKSIRANQLNMGDAYIRLDDNELWMYNLHIGLYKNAGYNAHTDPVRRRKLLAHRVEIDRMLQKVKAKGYTLFPVKLFENEKGLFKITVGLGAGKKMYDKRDDLKQKDIKKQIKQYL